MARDTHYLNWKRNFFYFSNYNSRLKIPLIISVTAHLAFFLTALSQNQPETGNEFVVTLNSTAQEAVIKNIDKFKTVKEQTLKNDTKDITTGNLVDSASIIQNRNNKKIKTEGNKTNTFNEEYEKTLFSRQKNSLESQSKHSVNADDNINWSEDNTAEFDSQSKENKQEAATIPGGKASSRSIKWVEGYARKLVYQAEIDYPLYFRKQGIQATLIVQIRVDAAGNVIAADITRSSGYSKLDILGRNGILKSKFSRKDNISSAYDIADVEIQFKLER